MKQYRTRLRYPKSSKISEFHFSNSNKPVRMCLEPSSRKWFVSNRFHHRDYRACKPLVSQYQILSVRRAWIYSSLSLPRVSMDPKHANSQQDWYVHCEQSFRGSKMPFHLVSQSDSSVINSELWNRLHLKIILGLDAWIHLHASHHKKRPEFIFDEKLIKLKWQVLTKIGWISTKNVLSIIFQKTCSITPFCQIRPTRSFRGIVESERPKWSLRISQVDSQRLQ